MPPRCGDHYDASHIGIAFLGTVARCCCCLPLPRRRYSSTSPPSAEQSLLYTNTPPIETNSTTTTTTAAPPLVQVATMGTASSPPSERQMLLNPKQQANQSHNSLQLEEKLAGVSKEEKEEEDEANLCPTCLEPFTADNPRVEAKCGHQYHLPCIYEWLERSTLCPMCGEKMEIIEEEI